MCGAAVVSYYNDTVINYEEFKLHINGMVPKGSYKFMVVAGGIAILWQHATDKIFFASKHLKAVMKYYYSTSHNRVIAYDNVAQKMIGNKVTPDAAGQFWGAPQVIQLKACVTGRYGASLGGPLCYTHNPTLGLFSRTF